MVPRRKKQNQEIENYISVLKEKEEEYMKDIQKFSIIEKE